MSAGRWTVVETMGAQDSWSVVLLDGRPTEFKSLARSLPVPAISLVTEAFDSAAPVERQLPPSRRSQVGETIRAVPVVAPDGVVHAVSVWVGDDAPDSVPAVGAFSYTSDKRLLRLSGEMHTRFDLPQPPHRTTWTGPEAFRRVVRFDTALDLISRTIDSTPNDRWQGQLTARMGNGLRRISCVFRNGSEDAATQWRCLAMDITEAVPPEPMTVETAALAALQSRGPATYIALMDIENAQLVRWVTDPIPDVMWQGIYDDRTTTHPEDAIRVREVGRRFADGSITSEQMTNVRFRHKNGGWTVVNANGSLLAHAGRATLILVEYTVVGHSDEPDPVPPPDQNVQF